MRVEQRVGRRLELPKGLFDRGAPLLVLRGGALCGVLCGAATAASEHRDAREVSARVDGLSVVRTALLLVDVERALEQCLGLVPLALFL